MESVGRIFPARSAGFEDPQQIVPGEQDAGARAIPSRRFTPQGYAQPEATRGGRGNASFRIAPDGGAQDNSFESLLQELTTLDRDNDFRRPAKEGVLESLLRRLIKHGFDKDDLHEIVRARPDEARLVLEELDCWIETLAQVFEPTHLVRIAKSGGASAVASAHLHGNALAEYGYKAADMAAVIEKHPNQVSVLATLITCTVDFKPCNYSASTLAEIAITRGLYVLSRLARLGPDLQRAGYAPDKLAEIVKTGGKPWQVLDALDALDRLRRDDARLLDCFEPSKTARLF